MMHIIAGVYKNRTIVSPKGELTRPTSARLREALFNICQTYIENARFLDLFAGSGAMGLEALSRGAKNAVFIDSSKESVQSIRENLHKLKLEETGRVMFGDVFQQLEKLSTARACFDIIYADPPYDAVSSKHGDLRYSQLVLNIVDNSDLLSDGGSLFIEEALKSRPESKDLKYMVLQSSRRMGRSTLQHYIKKPS